MEDIARNIVANCTRFTQKLKEPSRYIAILKILSKGFSFLSEETKEKLKSASIFLPTAR